MIADSYNLTLLANHYSLTIQPSRIYQTMSNDKKLRGFALLSKEEAAKMGARGGRRAHELGKAHTFSPAEASAAGKKGRLAAAAKRKAGS
jgi:hypothetical protein